VKYRWYKAAYIKCVVSQGSTGTDAGWGGNLNGHWVASCVRNICTKKLLKSDYFFQVAIDNVGNVFWPFLFILLLAALLLCPSLCPLYSLFCVYRFPEVVQKHTLGEVGTWMVVWWPVVSGIFVPKIIKICWSFFKLQSIMSHIFFFLGGGMMQCTDSNIYSMGQKN